MVQIKFVQAKKLTCESCGYVWIARFCNPKVCPRCKYKIVWDEQTHAETLPEVSADNGLIKERRW